MFYIKTGKNGSNQSFRTEMMSKVNSLLPPRQECHSHGHAVVYHAAPTRPSARDHAPVHPSLAGVKHTFASYWCCL